MDIWAVSRSQHFANHDDISVLAQEGTESLAEGKTDALVDGHLHDPFDVILDRVLGGKEFGVNGVDAAQARVKRGGLAAARRAGDDENAIGPGDDLGDVVVNELGQAEAFDLEVDRGAIEDAEHDRFSELSGQSGDAEVNGAIAKVESDASVLREPALRNVEVGHDLDARDHRKGQTLGGRGHLIKRAIHAVTDLELVLERLEMDVARAVLHGLKKDEVDKPDDGNFVREVRKHGRIVGVDRTEFGRDFLVRPDFLENVGETLAVIPAVILFDQLEDLAGVGNHHLDVLLHHKTKLIHVRGVQRFHESHLKGVVMERDGNALIHAGRGGGYGFHEFHRKIPVAQRDDLGADVIGLELELRVHVHDAEILQYLVHGLVTAGLFSLHLVELQVVNEALFLDQGQQRACG